MLNRRVLIGIAALSMSAVALANGVKMAAPVAEGGFFAGIEGMYWQPNAENMVYALADKPGMWHGDLVSVEPNHDFGFGIEAGYRFLDSRTDITVAYTRFHNSDRDTTIETEYVDVYPLALTSYGEYEQVTGSVDFGYDAVDVMLGKCMSFGNLNLHLATGVRYASVDYDFGINAGAGHHQFNSLEESDFDGIGPRFVASGSYLLGSDISLVASVGTSLLIGDGSASLTEECIHLEEDETEVHETASLKRGDLNRVVPELDGKLGLSYLYHANRCDVAVELGWKAVNYFGVAEGASIMKGLESQSISFNGPYLGLKLMA